MFNPTQIVIQAFVEQLKDRYDQIYGILEPAYPAIIGFVGRLALENISNSDAAYHDMNHTIMVTLVGQEILLGKHTSEGGVKPRDWLHFMISLLGPTATTRSPRIAIASARRCVSPNVERSFAPV